MSQSAIADTPPFPLSSQGTQSSVSRNLSGSSQKVLSTASAVAATNSPRKAPTEEKKARGGGQRQGAKGYRNPRSKQKPPRKILEELTELPLVSDFLERPILLTMSASSQIGESAPRGALITGVTNTVNCRICRESHCAIHINGGPEIGFASTKSIHEEVQPSGGAVDRPPPSPD